MAMGVVEAAAAIFAIKPLLITFPVLITLVLFYYPMTVYHGTGVLVKWEM
jgi:hypothetical protein